METDLSPILGTEPNGRVLTAKFIEVEPYPWLDFLEKLSKKIAPEFAEVLNSELQGRNDEKSGFYKIWWGQIAQVLTIYKEDIREKLYYAIIET